jgi:hypothetical protein
MAIVGSIRLHFVTFADSNGCAGSNQVNVAAHLVSRYLTRSRLRLRGRNFRCTGTGKLVLAYLHYDNSGRVVVRAGNVLD